MVMVTDKNYSMDGGLKKILDKCIVRQKKKHDHLFIIDGDEGYGKSTLGMQIAYYVAQQTGKVFNEDNVFFDLEEMLKFASNTEEQVIVWDEAVLGAMASQWQNKLQQKLIQILMTARKKRHFWFFIIPKFFTLKEYVILYRAIGLIHVYSPDHESRGYFTYYNKRKKEQLFHLWRKGKGTQYGKYKALMGRFSSAVTIDEDKYEARKDEAIKNIFKDEEKANPKVMEIKALKSLIVDRLPYSLAELGRVLGIPKTTLSDWNKLSKDKEVQEYILGKYRQPAPK